MAARVTAFVVFAIVAVTFVAGLIVGAQRADESGPVDLIVYNARVYTGNPDQAFAEAIAIRGNRILRVGSNREIKRMMRHATNVIDAHGGSVTAGFHDGSVDLKAAGLALDAADQIAASLAAADAADRIAASALPSTLPSSSAPSSSTPPASAPPASVTASAGAGAAPVGSTAAAGARARSAAASKPIGETTRAGKAAVDRVGAEPRLPANGGPGGDTLEAIRRAIGEANSVGVTSVDVTAHTPDDLLPYDTLLRTRELTARVTAALTADWPLDEAGLARLDATRKRYEGVPFFKVEAVRLMVSDGLDERTGQRTHVRLARRSTRAGSAASGHNRSGQPRAAATAKAAPVPLAPSPLVADLGRTIAALEERGWLVILQTVDVGDVTLVADAVDSMKIALPGAGAPKPATEPDPNPSERTMAVEAKHRVRVELGTSVDDATAARLTKLGIVASIENADATDVTADAHTVTNARADKADSADKDVTATADAATSGDSASRDSASGDAASDAGASDATTASDDGEPKAGPNADTEATADADVTVAGASEAPAAPAAPKPWPYANLIAGAAPFVFHSSWPAAPIDPRFALSAVLLDGLLVLADEDPASNTATPNAAPDRELLSARLARAIDAYTRHAAYASGDEDRKGTIAKEMLADLVIFSADLFTLPANQLLEAEVTTTIFDGKVVYTRQPEPAAVSDSE